jgi:hypothetical protein
MDALELSRNYGTRPGIANLPLTGDVMPDQW